MFADETTQPIIEEVTETTTETTEHTTAPEEYTTEIQKEPPTSSDEEKIEYLAQQVSEAWKKGEIIQAILLAAEVVGLVIVILLKKSLKKQENANFGENGTYTAGQRAQVKATNNLIESANQLVNAIDGKDGIKENILDKKGVTPLNYLWASEGHTGTEVWCFVNGKDIDFAQYSRGIKTGIKNTDIFEIIKDLYQVN